MLTQHHTDVGGNDCACAGEMLIAASRTETREDDCACVPSNGKKTLSSCLSTSRWQIAPGLLTYPLTTDKTLVISPAASGRVAVLDRQEMSLLAAFAEPRPVDDCAPALLADKAEALIHLWSDLGLLAPAESDCACADSEIDCACASTDATCRAVQPVGLTAWLHLTDRCNLRCDYCYLPHAREDMSLETGRAAIEATFRSALANGFQHVKFKYAGGEPLLRFPLIVELHQYAWSLAERHGLSLEGVVLSNGTLLTESLLSTLGSLNLRLMISLDGLGAYHDAHRRYAGGRGSFADVVEAVDLALAHGLTPNISVTVSGRTAEGLPEVVAWILERDLPFSLNFYRENPLSASHDDLRLDEEKIIAGMLAAFKVIEENLPRRPFLGGIIDRANLAMPHVHTCGVGQNYLVFDQNGQVAKCQMHIRKPVTNVHAADPLAILRADRLGVQNVSVEEKEGCRECQWRYWCAGGCPLETFRATGRYDVKSPNCNIYHALFPAALRLEGLRLLKYQDDPEVVEKIVV